jgi:hypothetical protein
MRLREGYQAWWLPQCGQRTAEETVAWNVTPQPQL